MNTKDQYCFELDSDKDVNKMIQWWNDIVFEFGNISLYDVKALCNIEPEYRDSKSVWSFELTTEKFETHIKRDNYHVKTSWLITLPEPESTL